MNKAVGEPGCAPTVNAVPVDNTPRHIQNTAAKAAYDKYCADVATAEAAGDPVRARRAARKRDRAAEEFVQANSGLAVSIARKLFPHGDPRAHNSDDYVAAAMMGLWEAFLVWDPTQSSFGHFAQRHIFGQVGRAVRATEASEISYGDFSARPVVRNAFDRLTTTLGRTPTVAEVAAEAEQPTELVARVLAARPASLDAPVGEDGATLGDLTSGGDVAEPPDVADLAGLLAEGDLEAVASATAHLPGDELWVLCRRLGLDGAPTQSLVEIAYEIERGRQTIQRLSARAVTSVTDVVA